MKKFSPVIAAFAMGASLLVACGKSFAQPNTDIVNETYYSPFVYICSDPLLKCDVVYDKDTMVMYVVAYDTNNTGNITALLNSDGTPKLWKIVH